MAISKITTRGMTADTLEAGDIAANAITASELADDAVDTAAIAADAVDGTKLADNAVDSEHYTDASIDTAHIGNDQIDSQHYAAASIDNEHLADDAVGVAELSATGTASSSTFLRGDNSWVAAGSPSITDNGNATAMTINTSEDVTYTGNIIMPTNKKVQQKGAFMQSSTHQSWVMGG